METAATTILWRLFRKGDPPVRAVVLPGGPPFTLAFFTDDQLDRAENYDDVDIAVFRANDIKRLLLDNGWQEA